MSRTVVIAEDEAIVRLDLREILEDQGFAVVGETGRGDEAVSLVKQHEPDLVILDIKMPGLDGLSAAKEINADGKSAVLILTAFSQRNLIEEARDAGAVAYLVKPFQQEELLPAIEVALSRFREVQALNAEIASGVQRTPDDQIETRRWVDRAKGALMDQRGLNEGDAFAVIEKRAASAGVSIKEAAQQIADGEASQVGSN